MIVKIELTLGNGIRLTGPTARVATLAAQHPAIQWLAWQASLATVAPTARWH